MILQYLMIFIGMTHVWDSNKIEFLKEYYPTKGGRFCANELELGLRQISSKVQQLGLSRRNPINLSDFNKITKPEISYILGLLWADGYIYLNTVNIECITDDMVFFEPIFNKIGRWNKTERERGYKPQTKLNISDKDLVKFLLNNDYGDKSTKSPTKILSKIPNELKHYFFRGLIDGDGCFYYNPKQYSRELSISGSYEQDWSYIVNLCESLNINNYKMYHRKTEHGNQSSFRITNKDGVVKLGTYIYKGDFFGLSRKFDKFKTIMES